jgi:hypothetical protein
MPTIPLRTIFDEPRFEDFFRVVAKLIQNEGHHDQ